MRVFFFCDGMFSSFPDCRLEIFNLLNFIESFTSGIQDPWIVVGALHASVKSVDLTRQFSCGESASVWQRAERLTLDVTFLFPLLEVSETGQFCGVLHPLDDLQHGDEVDVVAGEHLVHEFNEGNFEFLLAFQPRSGEVKTERSAVGGEMTVEVVLQHLTELFTSGNVGTRIDQSTTGQRLVEFWVVATIQLVDDHLPDGVATTGASTAVTAALVGGTEVEGVRPDGHAAQRCCDGGVVNEKLVSHHFVLFVSTDAEGWGADTDDGAVGDVSETFDDDTATGHLGQPIVVGTFAPVGLVVIAGDGESGDFVTATVEVLNGRVVGVSVGHEESSFDLAAVGVLAGTAEDFFVQFDVVTIDGTVEGEGDHLGNVSGFQFTGDLGTVRRAEAIGQHALGRVAFGSAVGIIIDGASVLIGAIFTVDVVVTEEFLVETLAVTASQFALGADGLFGFEKGKCFARTFKFSAVADFGFPVASLSVDVESQTGRAANGGQADGTFGSGLVATHHVATITAASQAEILFGVAVFAQLFVSLRDVIFHILIIVLTSDTRTLSQTCNEE